METPSFGKRKDPVARLVHDMTAAEVTGWLVEFHGLNPSSSKTVEDNLRDQFKYHRLQGRLDRNSNLAILAELLKLRQSVKVLERAAEDVEYTDVDEDFGKFVEANQIPADHLGIELIFKAFAANWTPKLK